MKKLKLVVAAFIISALLVGGIGAQLIANEVVEEKEKVIITTEEGTPNQDPDPIKT